MNHDKIYRKIIKKDEDFKRDLRLTGSKLPLFADHLDVGIFNAAYGGWILGKYGPLELTKRRVYWGTL